MTGISIGYSEYWRKNSSHVEKWEMAFILNALKKVQSYVTEKMKPIGWKGISDSKEGKILLDPSFIAGEYPIPPGKVDALVGWVVHEAIHANELSDLIWYKFSEQTKGYPIVEGAALLEMVSAGEDIYVQNVVRGTIWELYLEKAWQWYYPRIKKEYGSGLTLLYDLWRKSHFEKNFALNPQHEPLNKPLNLLTEYGRQIIDTSNQGSTSQKAIARYNLYQELWDLFRPYVQEWGSGLISVLPFIDGLEVNEELESKTGEKQIDYSLPKKIDFDALREILAKEEDLSSQIKMIVDDKYNVIPTFFWDEQTPCRVLPDANAVRKLRSVFEAQRQKNEPVLHSVNRGLLFGKIDERHLYRSFIDGRVFKEKIYNKNQHWDITILVDASESMAIDKKEIMEDNWHIVQKTFCSLYEASKGYKNKIKLFAYQEQGGRCYVLNLLRDNHIFTTVPKGKTPSGQAILAVALNVINDQEKKNLLIHITDGESNIGVDVFESIRYCEKRKINLFTIGCGYNEKLSDYFVAMYKNIYLMDSLEELPIALEVLLKRTLLN